MFGNWVDTVRVIAEVKEEAANTHTARNDKNAHPQPRELVAGMAVSVHQALVVVTMVFHVIPECGVVTSCNVDGVAHEIRLLPCKRILGLPTFPAQCVEYVDVGGGEVKLAYVVFSVW